MAFLFFKLDILYFACFKKDLALLKIQLQSEDVKTGI